MNNINSDLSFCKFTFPQNIKKVIWEITNQCNYSCEYCIFSSTGKIPRGELSFEQCIEVIDQLKEQGFNHIKFTGGEPFMRQDFLAILSYAQNNNFSFDISTNASFITEDISYQLSLLNINFIHVSLDGHDAYSHEIVRGKKSYNKTISGLKNLTKYNKNIRLGCVIHLNNQNNLQDIVNFADSQNIKQIIFSIMSPLGKMSDDSLLLTDKKPTELIENINKLSSDYTKINHNLLSDLQPISFKEQEKTKNSSESCPGGTKFLFIDSIGIVSPCTWISDKFPKFHTQSLHEQSLTTILNSPLFKEFEFEKSKLIGKCPAFEYKENKKFQTIYSFATENLSFLDNLPKNKFNNALTITGSGDQALLLCSKGVKNITCIDINYLAQHYTELKIIALQHLSFNDFQSFFKNHLQSFNYQIFKKLSSFLSINCEKFWNLQYIKHNYNGYNIRNSNIFNLVNDSWTQKIKNVSYLSNEIIFNSIKEQIHNTHFEFLCSDFKNTEFNQTYDIILLSNIADYSHYIFETNYVAQFKIHFVVKGYNLLNKNGIFMFAYIYDFQNIGNSYLRNKINLPIVRKKYFKSFNYYEKIIPTAIPNLKNDVVCFISK